MKMPSAEHGTNFWCYNAHDFLWCKWWLHSSAEFLCRTEIQSLSPLADASPVFYFNTALVLALVLLRFLFTAWSLRGLNPIWWVWDWHDCTCTWCDWTHSSSENLCRTPQSFAPSWRINMQKLRFACFYSHLISGFNFLQFFYSSDWLLVNQQLSEWFSG